MVTFNAPAVQTEYFICVFQEKSSLIHKFHLNLKGETRFFPETWGWREMGNEHRVAEKTHQCHVLPPPPLT